jgi:hypothetical protein
MLARALAVMLALLAIACADVPEAAVFEVPEGEAPDVEGVPVIPYGARIFDPPIESAPIEAPDAEEDDDEAVAPTAWPAFRGEPRVTVGPWKGERADDENITESALCPFEVRTRGFPAISSDGSTIIGVSRGAWSASDGEDEVMVVRWHDVARDEIVHSATVYDGEDEAYDDEDTDSHCKRLWRGAKRAALDVNARIAEGSWRTLVDVGIQTRDGIQRWADEEMGDEVPPTAAPRPVELVHVGKQAALRIRGVEVLYRADVDWLGTESWPCKLAPNVLAVLGDRESGTLAVFVDHQTDGCLCDSKIELRALRVPAAIFAEAARRPSPRCVPDTVIETTQ